MLSISDDGHVLLLHIRSMVFYYFASCDACMSEGGQLYPWRCVSVIFVLLQWQFGSCVYQFFQQAVLLCVFVY